MPLWLTSRQLAEFSLDEVFFFFFLLLINWETARVENSLTGGTGTHTVGTFLKY